MRREGSEYDSDTGDLRTDVARLDERSRHMASESYVEKRVGEVEKQVQALQTTIANWWRFAALALGVASVGATLAYILIRLTVSGAL